MKEVEITSEKSFQIELSSDKNNSHSIEFNLNNYIEIIAKQINNIIHQTFSSKYSFEEIRENKYFLQFDTLDEIFEEIKDKIYNNKIIIKENDNKLILNISLSDNEDIIFELKPINKNSNDRLNELSYIITKLNMEIKDIKNENIHLKKGIEQLTNEFSDKKDKEEQLKNDINQLKDEIIQLKNDKTQLINENIHLKNLVTKLNEKSNILWKERNKIEYSKIINGKEKYYERLKNWINPSKKLKAELLYRLSENGDNKSTFHELCDNKGPTLTLFHVNDENIVGIYSTLSWDSISYWKKDMDTFIFNLNKNQKYKKLKNDYSIYCDILCGPFTNYFGCYINNSMKSITHCANNINKYYDKGSEILPSNNQTKEYDLIETEVYKIIIE